MLENEKKFKVEYTKKGNPIKGSYDRSDSLVVVKAGYYLWEKEKENEANKNKT
jgi:hypothetical protein